MQKHISLAESTPTAHIFNLPTIDVNSQDPYLLGFNSNVVPNFNILLFQPYPGEDSEYLGQSERFTSISAFSLGNNPNNWEIHFNWFYFFTGYSRVHCKYRIHRLFTGFGKKNPNNREIHQKEQWNGKNSHTSTGNFRKFRTIAVLLHADREH